MSSKEKAEIIIALVVFVLTVIAVLNNQSGLAVIAWAMMVVADGIKITIKVPDINIHYN